MKRNLAIVFLTASMLGGCSSLISAARETPIQEDPASRTTGDYIQDHVVETKIEVNLNKGSEALKNSHINVTSYNGQILLTGQVPNTQVREEAGRVAGAFREVRKVHNELTIGGPTSAIIRANDSFITSKIKLQLLGNNEVPSSSIKVVTENGTVYLMGLVTRAQADAATDIIRSITGVNKIVKVFEYID